MIAYFRFQIWIRRGQIIKITLFSSRGKTKSLNLFFSVINTVDYEKVIANKSPTHLLTWKFFCGVHMTTQRDDIFSQMNPMYILTPVLGLILILSSDVVLHLSNYLVPQHFVSIFHLSCVLQALHISQ